MIEISQLAQAEREIESLLNKIETNWKDVAKVAITVREKQLFLQPGSKVSSFTAWVSFIARKCDRHPSLIWRYIKAAKYYLRIAETQDLEALDKATAAPEALVNLEKVERFAPQPVFTKLKDRVLTGKVSVKETRRIEQEYRPDPEDREQKRGRPVAGKEGSYEHLGKQELPHNEHIDPSRLLRNQITATISRSLNANLAEWTRVCTDMSYPSRFTQGHTEVRVIAENPRMSLDFLGVVRWNLSKPKDIFGVEIKSSVFDFKSDRQWHNYLNFCHYFCFAIFSDSPDLRAAIEEQTDPEIGILEIDFSSKVTDHLGYQVNVYRKPRKLAPISASLVYETLYERALGWSNLEELLTKKITRHPESCNPVKGDRVFAVQYTFGWQQPPEWLTVGAIDERDAAEFIQRINTTPGGRKPEILSIVEQFYNSEARAWLGS